MLHKVDNPGPGHSPTAIIIGSGFGGLAAAVRLLARGYRVSVLEALDQPGGRARVFRENGFTFDAGPTIITAPFLFEDLWALHSKRMSDHVRLVSLDPFYTIRTHDGRTFDYGSDTDAMKAQIGQFSRRDVAGYDPFIGYSKALYDKGFVDLCHMPVDTIGKMLKVTPHLVRLGFQRSVYQAVSRYFKDPVIRQVFSFHSLLIGGNPYTTTAIYAMISYLEKAHGVHFAMGGTGALVTGLVDLIRGAGGTVRLQSPVTRIDVEGGRAVGVTLKSGERLRADIIVSNADSATTYTKLLGPEVRKRWTVSKVRKKKFSMSLFVWYFGTNRRFESVPHHMIMLGPRYRGLLRDIFANKSLAEDFSLYLHRPTATDPSLAPEGCDGFYVLSPVPNTLADIDWAKEAEAYRARIEAYLDATVLPGLKGSVVASRMLTPNEFESELQSYRGAGFSFAPSLLQSAWFRPHNRSETIKNLYLVGAGTHPGAGLPGVLSSARVLDTVVPDVTPASL